MIWSWRCYFVWLNSFVQKEFYKWALWPFFDRFALWSDKDLHWDASKLFIIDSLRSPTPLSSIDLDTVMRKCRSPHKDAPHSAPPLPPPQIFSIVTHIQYDAVVVARWVDHCTVPPWNKRYNNVHSPEIHSTAKKVPLAREYIDIRSFDHVFRRQGNILFLEMCYIWSRRKG